MRREYGGEHMPTIVGGDEGVGVEAVADGFVQFLYALQMLLGFQQHGLGDGIRVVKLQKIQMHPTAVLVAGQKGHQN